MRGNQDTAPAVPFDIAHDVIALRSVERIVGLITPNVNWPICHRELLFANTPICVGVPTSLPSGVTPTSPTPRNSQE